MVMRLNVNRWGVILSVLVLLGCMPQDTQPLSQPLPTFVPTAPPAAYNLENANRVAIEFLDAWERNAFDEMHARISFASREATPLANFTTTYQNAHDTLTLQSLHYVANVSGPDASNRVMVFNYTVTFKTQLFGDFQDAGRDLRLVFDETEQNWRVAWSPGDIFKEMGSGGTLRRETTEVRRGNIYDRNGGVIADLENPVATVILTKQEIRDPEKCYETLYQALSDTPQSIIQARLNAASPHWRTEVGSLEASAYVQWQTPLEADCNATFGSIKTRRYRNGSLMPHIVGTVGYLNENEIPAAVDAGFRQDSILGRSGIERSQDLRLRGKSGARLTIVTPNGNILREIANSPLEAAEGVWLTIDSDLQQVVLDTFALTYANSEILQAQSKGAAAIVMNVNTGEILALVSWPTYDINAFAPFPAIGKQASNEIMQQVREDTRNPQLNRVTQGRYPSGSLMKIATAMAAVDSGVFSPTQQYACGGVWSRDGVIKTDWLAGGHGMMTPVSALTQSCNPFFYEAGYQMNRVDPYLLPNYLRQAGLGSRTGLTDIEEDGGYIGDMDTMRLKNGNWTFADAVVQAIGQGEVEVTPLQMLRLVAAVANGGTLYKPQIVWRSGILDNFSYTMQPEVNGNIDMKPEVIAMAREGMCAVTDSYGGTAEHIFYDSELISKVGVCAKTGTAQDLTGPKLPHAWFGAYAPKENPEIAIVVMVENAGEGSAVAAPITRTILEYYFLGIRPTPNT